ncbi:hypothetical protein EJ03DRAFT_353958 [Teratosphaeria nubilosa]|uniref:BTB domain-containing protein n=1 Tax=Teratosphaeria nubilosa TaxID=161662 RepID=A0A6G1L0L7_9PEZI|nr:hypothetical protein EJ03DRAFT_353958 [Teratosphaeria nubilosa]
MAEPEEDLPRTYLLVAAHGDIILVLRRNRYVRVRSSVLSDSSRVFNAMLGPDFMEGQGTGTVAQPKEIQLLEDDEQGMIFLCQMLHNSQLDDICPSDLLEVAKLAGKYDCVAAVHMPTEAILSRYHTSERMKLDSANPWDMRTLTAAAYLLNHAWFFHDFTQRFVLDSMLEYDLSARDRTIFHLPVSILRQMQN